jgi:orotidine-5'-phosphate decarboxylase
MPNMSARHLHLSAAQRLVVALDFNPEDEIHRAEEVALKTRHLAQKLRGTGVTLKINSVARANGHCMIGELHDLGFEVFADLKLFDIKSTLATDGKLLQEYKPELLTVVCTAGAPAMEKLRLELPDTEVLGVTVLTDHDENMCQRLFGCSIREATIRFAKEAKMAKIGGLISAANDVEELRGLFDDQFSYNNPAIRPSWAVVKDDTQNPDRKMGPAEAIMTGATRIIVGRPILDYADPREAVMRTIEEIQRGLAAIRPSTTPR